MDPAACADLTYFCLFDMKRKCSYGLYETILQICKIYQCIIEDDVYVYAIHQA